MNLHKSICGFIGSEGITRLAKNGAWDEMWGRLTKISHRQGSGCLSLGVFVQHTDQLCGIFWGRDISFNDLFAGQFFPVDELVGLEILSPCRSSSPRKRMLRVYRAKRHRKRQGCRLVGKLRGIRTAGGNAYVQSI